jgi:hypothetical protein
MDLDLSAIEELAKAAGNGMKAEYVVHDLVHRIQPLLKNTGTFPAAINELQKWAEGEDGLRKAVASQFLERMRGALGGMHASAAVAHWGKKVGAGEAGAGSAALKSRFANRHHPVASPSAHPAAQVQHGEAAPRLDPNAKPAPKVQHGMVPHPRLSAPPPPAAAAADKAHAGGAKLAAMGAHHGFKLGLAAAAAAGAAGAAHAHAHKPEHVAKAADEPKGFGALAKLYAGRKAAA